MAELFIGGTVDPATHQRTADEIRLDAAELTTHAVIVGMTGSGKTGLGIVLVEEVLASGRPALLIDPKGDLTNLCLTFPALAAADFQPWVDERAAAEAGTTTGEFAAAEAQRWAEGLAAWGYGTEQIRRLRETVDLTIYTPGSTAGVPIDVVGSLDAPTSEALADHEQVADRVEGYVTGVLGLAGIPADPLASPEHILLSNLIHHAWSGGASLDLAALVSQVQDPPFEKLGVLDVDEFLPAKDRRALAVRLNALLASPSFASWQLGAPIDIQAMLYGPGGRPRCAIVTTSHLSDEERQFATSLLLGAVISWMRTQAGVTDLRALVYLDEVVGYLPPTESPPTKKPIMTLMKQARAFGVGVVLATQNPVDIDYKAISNAGTWMVGRLQTERDKQRLLDGMSSADGGVDVAAVGHVIGGLAKREFVVRRAGRDEPEVFTTRWAMSYLRGPITTDEIARLQPKEADGAGRSVRPPASTPSDAPDVVPAMPPVAAAAVVRWLDAAAPGVEELGGQRGGSVRAAAVVVEVQVRYDDTKLGLTHDVALVLGCPLRGDRLDAAAVVDVPVDVAALRSEAPGSEPYRLPGMSLDAGTGWTQFRRDLVEHVRRTRPLEVEVNPALKLANRPGETPADFAARCAEAAHAGAEADRRMVGERHERARARLVDQREDADARAAHAVDEAAARRRGHWLRAAGDVLGGVLGGGRRAGGRIGRAAERLTRGTDDRRSAAARTKVERLDARLAELDAELRADVAAVDARWAATATERQTAEVYPDKSDVHVSGLYLVWVPAA